MTVLCVHLSFFCTYSWPPLIISGSEPGSYLRELVIMKHHPTWRDGAERSSVSHSSDHTRGGRPGLSAHCCSSSTVTGIPTSLNDVLRIETEHTWHHSWNFDIIKHSAHFVLESYIFKHFPLKSRVYWSNHTLSQGGKFSERMSWLTASEYYPVTLLI